jgi:hypothetical protein
MCKKFLRRFFPAKQPMLGRWCLHDTSNHHWKVDMANVDHCGTCAHAKDMRKVEKKPQ